MFAANLRSGFASGAAPVLPEVSDDLELGTPSAVIELPEPLRQTFTDAIAGGMQGVLAAAALLAAAGLAATVAMRSTRLSDKRVSSPRAPGRPQG